MKRRFIFEEHLGSGGLCEVFKAKDLLRVECGGSFPSVALKRLLPEYRNNAIAEQLISKEFFILGHLAFPGVNRVFDLHKENWGIAISMELLEGKNMYDRMAGGPLPTSEACACASRLFGTLCFLHGRGIAHGDIKPGNIYCERDERLVLIDFTTAEQEKIHGKASAIQSQGLRANPDIPGFSKAYASLDRLLGAQATPSADIYAACCTVYEFFHGSHPFQRLSATEALERKMEPTKPRTLSLWQWKALKAGLSFTPADRPQAGELQAAFQGIIPLAQWHGLNLMARMTGRS